MAQAQDQVVQCGPVALAVRDYGGRGSAVVLLHGGTRNLGDWTTIAPTLAAQHRVVALDFRSHGASTPCGASWTVADAVADVQAVITAFHLDTPWLVGHSIGGMVATQYAAEQGTCRGVINIDGVGVSVPPVLPGPDPAGIRVQLQTMIAQMADALDPASATPPRILSAAALTQHLAAQRTQAMQRGEHWSVLGPTAERAWFQRADGQYEETPSAAAVTALSQAVLGMDIFALTRAVRCPLLFIEAINHATAVNNTPDALDIMQAWRVGVQMTFAHIAVEHPHIAWHGMVGDHMLVPHQAAQLTNVLLPFLQAGSSTETRSAR